jgi:peptidoglycan/xylan/chitin deacetylase (PgdA/CDA1 family)
LDRFISLSITLDGMPEYGARLGLPLNSLHLSPDELDPIYGKAWPRALRFLARHDLNATLFPLGKYLGGQVQTALLRETIASGHEVGNYTSSGILEFSRLSSEEAAAEIQRGEETLQDLASHRPRGFCIPGRQGAHLAAPHLKSKGYLYDASAMALPAVAALGLRAGQLLRRLGLQIPVLANEPQALWAASTPGPMEPGFPLWSLPVSAVPGLRVPLCGAVLSVLGASRISWLLPLFRRQNFVHITCNGLDFLTPDEVSDEVKARAPYLKTSLAEREETLAKMLSSLAEGAALLPLVDAYAALRSL